jgi:UDP-glucose 4-epimerase
MKVLILGGAGFLGSRIAKECVARGYKTIIVDGLLERTGGRRSNLKGINSEIEFIPQRIEQVNNLPDLIADSDFTVCAMAWTSHVGAMKDPLYDVELNLLSHVRLLAQATSNAKLIYLGSRVQFGDIQGPISELAPMIPTDVQGVNKTAAESYYRIFSRAKGLVAVSVRLPACFGLNQPVTGDDLGLMGNMIRDLICNKRLIVYGKGRMRSFLYADDCAKIICDLGTSHFSGFSGYNISGTHISIAELANKLIKLIGKGSCEIHEVPHEINAVDSGNAQMDESLLRATLGIQQYTPFDDALSETIDYFKRELVS